MRLSDSFQVANRIHQFNRWCQILLILSLIGGINYVAFKHFQRWDLTQNKRYSLAAETIAYLGELDREVTVYITVPLNSPRREEQILENNLRRLLQDFAYHSRRQGTPMIQVEHVDIYQDPARAEFLSRQHGLTQANAILVVSADRKRLLRAEELIEFKDNESIQFRGEARMIAAILDVSQDNPEKLYFLTGHQEISLENASPQFGLSRLARELRLRNFNMEVLDLARVTAVPADAAAVVIASPKGPFLASEVEKLRSYLLDRSGRILLWAGPGVDLQLDLLLRDWGLVMPDHAIHEPDSAYRDSSGTLLLRNIGQHPITEALLRNQTYVLSGWARPVIGLATSNDERLSLNALLASSAASWSESAYRSATEPVFNSQTDLAGPVPIGFVAERRAATELGIRLVGGRLVVIGTGDIFSNAYLASIGNQTLLLGIINWLIDRHQQVAIPPRPIERYQLAVSESEMHKIAFLFFAIPGCFALLGLIVYWIRQS